MCLLPLGVIRRSPHYYVEKIHEISAGFRAILDIRPEVYRLSQKVKDFEGKFLGGNRYSVFTESLKAKVAMNR